MENVDKDEKMLAILQFIHCYDPDVSMSTMVNGVSFMKLLGMIPVSQFNFTCKINKQAQKWSEQVQNLQNILFKIEEYFEQVHEKCLQTSNIDLINLTKHGSLEQLIKYFEIVMSLLMESSIKESFIQSIMNLQQTSQQIFVAIIKQSLDPHNFTKTKYKANTFYRLISEFEEENQTLTQQIQRLCGANSQLVQKCKEYEDTINEIQLDLSQKKSGGDNSLCQESKNSKYLEEYIDKLQARIVEQSKVYEAEKMGFAEETNELQQRICKLEQIEELGKIYKQKYDEIMDQMQKMNIWKREKAKMEKVMEEKDFIVQKLHDRIEELTEKNLSLEQAELQFKLDLQKKQLQIQKISNELKKFIDSMGNSSLSGKMGESYMLDQSIKECINKRNEQSSVFAREDELNLMRKQNEKLLKKIKQLEKQIIKLTKKVERLRMLEEDKNKLEQLVFRLRTTQSEQLNLMFATFYEGFEQNLESSKKLRYAVLNFNEDEIIKKSKHNRKKTGSNLSVMSKGKQN